jgi:hypothetical protein
VPLLLPGPNCRRAVLHKCSVPDRLLQIAAVQAFDADSHQALMPPLQLTVKGLVRLEKLGPFFEELRSASRHRTLSLALLRAPPDSSPSASGLLAKVWR